MPNLLDGKIAKDLGKAMKQAGLTKPATLIKVTSGTRTPGSLAGGTNPTTTNVKARGLVSTKKHQAIAGTAVEVGDRVVLLFGSLIAGGVEPAKSDRLTIENKTQNIIAVDRDPASATYTCLCRG